MRPAAGNGRGPGRAGNGPPPAGSLDSLRRLLPDLRLSLPRWAARWTQPRLPEVAVLFDRNQFSVVRVLPGEKGGRPVLTHLVSRTLPPGSLVPRIDRPNLATPADVAGAVQRVLDQLPNRKKLARICVVIPDSSALVTLLTLRDLPGTTRQATDVIRWQVRKRVPFNLEDARISFQRFPLPDGSERVLVALALETVIVQYEQLMESLGLLPGLVDLSTLNLANLVDLELERAGENGVADVALLNLTPERLSLMVLRRRAPLFYRSKSLIHDLENEAEAATREVQRELASSVNYYRERLAGKKGSIGCAFLRSAPAGEQLERLIGEVLGVRPRRLNPAAHLQLPESANPADLDLAAPALGLLLARGMS